MHCAVSQSSIARMPSGCLAWPPIAHVRSWGNPLGPLGPLGPVAPLAGSRLTPPGLAGTENAGLRRCNPLALAQTDSLARLGG